MPSLAVPLLAALAALAVGCSAASSGARSAASGQARSAGGREREQARVASNVTRADYAGSAACGGCHADVVARWRGSPMHEMTRDPGPGVSRAPFDGATTVFKGDRARLATRQGRPIIELDTRSGEQHVYLVTRVIGGHHREDFAGLEIPARGPGLAPIGDARRELILPVSYVYDGGELRPKGYSVMVGERPGLHAGGVWNETCVFCHNTVPWMDTALGALAGPHAPGYQGVLVDRTLPAEKRWSVALRDGEAFREALGRELAALGAPGELPARPAEAARAGVVALRERFGAQHFVEEGIGCESCHGGSREHVDDPRVLPSFAVRSPFLSYQGRDARASTEAAAQNRVCARCHQVLFSRYPYTWEGGLRRGGAEEMGGSSITSGEARDFLLGGCSGAMTCTTCHDPHGLDDPARLAALATPAGNGVCTTCHGELAAPAALARHAHHDPAGAGGSCVACHMPRKNTGLGYALTRYHRLGSPLAPARVEKDRPLECALCHTEASARKLLDDIARLWGKTYDRAAVARLYGDLDRPLLEATVEDGRAHEQIAAAATLAEAKVKRAARPVARFVALSAFPLARRWGKRSLETLLGHPCAADVDGGPEDIALALARCDAALAGLSVGRAPASSPTVRGSAPTEDDD